jgi:hypothetical protein
MAILFVPNDPLAQADAPARQQPPRPEPSAGRAGFAYSPNRPPEAPYPFGSAEFLFWQCREGALAALGVLEALAHPLASWQGERRLLQLVPNAGRQLNAEYDRSSLSFYEWSTPAKTTFSAASTDAVAHEVGHALLDALRPDLWDSSYTEPAAFHEAFADCFALLAGLSDAETRRAHLRWPALRQRNFLEAIAEDVSNGVWREDAQNPHAEPRHAFNDLVWQIPIRLKKLAAPGELTSEPHSFSRVFTGCFYDTLCNVFDGLPGGDEQALLEAATIAGKLLLASVRDPPEVPRFFQAVGRMMTLADEAESGGRHHAAIRNAFQAHGIALGSNAMAAPTAALEGAVSDLSGEAGAASLAPAAKRDLRRRMRAPSDAKLAFRPLEIAGQKMLAAVHRRIVKIGGLDARLRGVVASAAESVLVGSGVESAEILGALSEPVATADEVRAFVGTLLEHGRIQFEGEEWEAFRPTHAIRRRGDRKVLTRVRFSCCAGRGGR